MSRFAVHYCSMVFTDFYVKIPIFIDTFLRKIAFSFLFPGVGHCFTAMNTISTVCFLWRSFLSIFDLQLLYTSHNLNSVTFVAAIC